MTLAFDAFSSADTTADPIEFTHTPVGTPRAIIVFINKNDTTDHVVGVTYGGTSMTEVALSPFTKSSGEVATGHIFHLGASIPTGAQTVSIDLTSSQEYIAGCISLTGADDTAVQNTVTHQSDNEEDPSVNLALDGNECWVGEVWGSGRGAPGGVEPMTSWTDRMEKDWGSSTAGVYTYDTIDNVDVACGFLTTIADDVMVFGIAVKESAAGGNVVPILSQGYSRFTGGLS